MDISIDFIHQMKYEVSVSITEHVDFVNTFIRLSVDIDQKLLISIRNTSIY